MRALSRSLAVILFSVLFLSLAVAPALAQVDSVKSNGDGSFTISCSGSNIIYLLVAPKQSDSFRDDYSTYYFTTYNYDGEKPFTMYYMAPGQSYWLATVDSSYKLSSGYLYEAPPVQDFSEFRQHPNLSDWQLKKTNASGSRISVNSFSLQEITSSLDTMDFGVAYHINYPQLKNPRHYIEQIVFTAPSGLKCVENAFEQELPAGQTYAYCTFYPFDDYFQYLLNRQGSIEPGVYRMTLFWNGQEVDSHTFQIQ